MGVIECNADHQLTVTVEGGTVLGFGSANPRTEERLIPKRCASYSVLLILRLALDDAIVLYSF